jgi:hypothetical protein
VFANGLKSAAAPVNLRLVGGMVTLQRQAHQQLRAAQIGPAAGSFI